MDRFLLKADVHDVYELHACPRFGVVPVFQK